MGVYLFFQCWFKGEIEFRVCLDKVIDCDF